MHNGFLQVEGEKMSKSLGNFVTIHELLRTTKFGGREWPGEVLRLAMLRTHYRQPIDWTVKALEEAEATLDGWYQTIGAAPPDGTVAPDVLDALSDDLNTPAAIAELHQLSRQNDGRTLRASLQFIGIPMVYRESLKETMVVAGKLDVESINGLILERSAARATRNWAESDRLRDELAALGVAIKDNKDGTTSWEPKR
jgi:cysteinyl-tRNA synthetase